MWFSLSQLLGVLSLAFPVLGAVVLLGTLGGALLFHVGWRTRHPNEFWPKFAWVSVGSGLLAGAGLILYNPIIAAAGIVMFFVARYMTGRATSDASGTTP